MDFFYPDIAVRLPLYIAFGLVTEILFTGISDLIWPTFLQSWRVKNLMPDPPIPERRDPRAVGYTFLWMIPIYALLAFVEPMSRWMADMAWFVRGMAYLVFIWLCEYFTGMLIKKITGHCPWDYSYSKFSFQGYIRWDFAPLWFIFGLIVEFFSEKFVLLTPSIRTIF